MNTVVLTTAYFPPISYISAIHQAKLTLLEKHENYQRQTVRNRCLIMSANGVQALSVPIVKSVNKTITDLEIDYATPWNYKQVHAIRSAYGKTPFFSYFSDELLAPLYAHHRCLFDLNMDILSRCIRMLEIPTKIEFTEKYFVTYNAASDLRSNSAKKTPPFCENYLSKPYIQAFAERFEFHSDLSILDLIFNIGKEGILVLK
jgi:hypothetical protein